MQDLEAIIADTVSERLVTDSRRVAIQCRFNADAVQYNADAVSRVVAMHAKALDATPRAMVAGLRV